MIELFALLASLLESSYSISLNSAWNQMIVVEHITCLTVDIDTLLPPFMHNLALLLCGPDGS
ncbi:hypothetical protein BDR06DRAFT_960850 [Suillus hirtellus]|nr:hypothetical protein BDR06DRAFT_960850 [Suillus hirtellus]